MEEEKYRKFLAPNEKIIKVLDFANSQLVFDIIIGILLIPVLIGFFQILWALYQKLTLRYIITDKRVIIKKGLIGHSTTSADYPRITDVNIKQGILGRVLLKTGTIVLNTAGTDLAELELKWVDDPFGTKNAIYEHLHGRK